MNTLPDAFSGLMLLCALVLLVRHRLAAMAELYRLQTLVLFAAALASSSYFAAIVALIQAVLFPIVLNRLPPEPAAQPSRFALPIGLGLICIAVLVVSNLAIALAIALAILLLGLLIMVTRRERVGQAIGFLLVENALLLGIAQTGQAAALCLPLFVLSAFLLWRLSCVSTEPA